MECLFIETQDIWGNEFGVCTVFMNRDKKRKKKKKKKKTKKETKNKGRNYLCCPYSQND